jgi:hypothetical protein
MKLTLKEPIIIGEGEEQKVYEYAFLNFSTSTGFVNPEQYTLALRLTPYRVSSDGTFDKLEERVSSYSYLDALNSPLRNTAIEILNVIQQIINKGV